MAVTDLAVREDIVKVELTKDKLIRNSGVRLVAQEDVQGNIFGVAVYKDGVPLELNDINCYGYFIRQDGETVVMNGTISGNVAYVLLPQSCYVYNGSFSLAIKITGGAVVETLRIIDGIVTQTTTDTIVDPGSVVPNLSQLLAQIADCESATTAANTAATNATNATSYIAPTYSTSSTYAVGDYVIYNGNLYRCTTAISTAESWTSGHWTLVQTMGEVNALKGSVNEIATLPVKTIAKYQELNFVGPGTNRVECTGLTPGDIYEVSVKVTEAANASWSILTSTTPIGSTIRIISGGTLSDNTESKLTIILGSSETSIVVPCVINPSTGNRKYWTVVISHVSNIDINIRESALPSSVMTKIKTVNINALHDGYTAVTTNFTVGGISTSGLVPTDNTRCNMVIEHVGRGSKFYFDSTYVLANYFYITSTSDFTRLYTPNVWDSTGVLHLDFKNDGVVVIILRDATSGSTDISGNIDEINAKTFLFLYNRRAVNWVAFGDSITNGSYSISESSTGNAPEYSYAYRIAKVLKPNEIGDFYNCGVRGLGWIDPGNNNETFDNMLSLYTGDKSIIELVTIMLGVNDYMGAQTLGTTSAEEDDGTISGAIRSGLKKICEQYPNAKVFAISPLNTTYRGNATTGYARKVVNSNAGTLEDIANMIKYWADYYGVEFIDETSESFLNSYNITGFLLDKLHPSDEGQWMFAREIARKIVG